MLTIRLQRIGKKHQPQFRIVLAEKHKSPSKKFLEILGNYNPRNKEFTIKNEERLQYWLGQNVETSGTIHNLLVEKGMVKEDKVQARRVVKKEEEKKEEAAPAEAASVEEPAAEAAPVEEAPATEETPAS